MSGAADLGSDGAISREDNMKPTLIALCLFAVGCDTTKAIDRAISAEMKPAAVNPLLGIWRQGVDGCGSDLLTLGPTGAGGKADTFYLAFTGCNRTGLLIWALNGGGTFVSGASTIALHFSGRFFNGDPSAGVVQQVPAVGYAVAGDYTLDGDVLKLVIRDPSGRPWHSALVRSSK